jgi:hypothetical protein
MPISLSWLKSLKKKLLMPKLCLTDYTQKLILVEDLLSVELEEEQEDRVKDK